MNITNDQPNTSNPELWIINDPHLSSQCSHKINQFTGPILCDNGTEWRPCTFSGCPLEKQKVGDIIEIPADVAARGRG